MTTLKIITANVYTANRRPHAARFTLERRGADVLGLQEAHWLGGLVGYRAVHAFRVDDRHSRQNVAAVRSDYRYEGHAAYRVTDELGGDKFAPDRWIVWQRFLAEGRPLCLIDTHVNAVLQREDGSMRSGPRIEQARRHMITLGREIDRQRRDGFDVLVTLDSNYARRPGMGRLWRHSPHATFRRAGLRYVPRRIDGIAVPKDAKVRHAASFDVPGSDHRGFEVVIRL